MTLGMAAEAVKGAVREVWTSKGVPPKRRVAILITLLLIIVRELVGTAMMAGYGTFAFWVYSSLPKWRKDGEVVKKEKDEKATSEKRSEKTVAVARNVQYGQTRRNLLDVYVPKRKDIKSPMPVVLFIHGGVWASGDKWQFSPLGTFLAEEGVVAVLAQYTLYPKVLAVDQVGEMSDALTWTMDNIAQYGGDPNRVFIMGHSSGSHLCAMVLWERACRRIENAQQPLPENVDIRIPAGYLGLAGVYNIGEHFKYELKRGVGAISCMRPAMGWEQGFDSMSPSLLFKSLLSRPGVSFGANNDMDSTAQIHIRGEDLFPRTLFIVSNKDITVPPDSSFAFDTLLSTEFGCESRVVVHDVLSHVDFVIWHEGWGKLKPHVGPFLEDILNFVRVEPSQQ
ncbi:hypothetical protein KC19_7G143700 [Ceratodon purpureus]|uniref:protein-S-isoprenylcysteine alpha-carbonyl methylesterase n=1 Tax=Ceratodon purpureus TaxID=3225 RepID=A0A8T0H833_CERPU|nr:hypothetical protein KC19_7G143700 [Ceratodon purpureus]